MRVKVLAGFLTILLAAGTTAAADLYKLDPAHTQVGFSVRHLAVTRVRGQFTQFSGEIWVDTAELTRSRLEVHIQAASINTANERRDADLKSERFLDVANHPEIVFKSKRIEKSDDGLVAVGDLTIRGVTHEVSLPFTVAGPINDPFGFRRIGVEAATTINRQDYDVSWNRVIEGGGLLVGNEVAIDITAEMVQTDPETGQPVRVEKK